MRYSFFAEAHCMCEIVCQFEIRINGVLYCQAFLDEKLLGTKTTHYRQNSGCLPHMQK